MSHSTTKNRLATFVAVASLLVAAVAILVPYVQQRRAIEVQQEALRAERGALQEQKRQFESQQAERLSVSAVAGEGGLLRIVRDPVDYVIQVPWEITWSNTGSQALSVTECEVSVVDTSTSFYYGVDGGIYDLNLNALSLPITLQPGESRKSIVYVGLCVPERVHRIVSGLKTPTAVRSAWEALLARRLDMFGNETVCADMYGNIVTSFDKSGPYVFIRYKGDPEQPTYESRVLTGRGNTVVRNATYY